ncbi:hypothetical protein [Cellulomonas sp. S1-8]|uniref:hypothetical protein n=1 Tax=Cellulomonas sp. S1-8 TaxID=2904790 RepID=UPI002243E440|nr:hypothetical protein [Cellulomonas sp. S1-8]UZN04218.1 hypothetical protein OKX07_04580 [Cellulomonas sp. S1-8]
MSRSRRTGRWLAVAGLCAVVVAAGGAVPAAAGTAEQQGMTTTDAEALGVPKGTRLPRAVDLGVPGDHSQAQHISDTGVVVGITSTEDEVQVFRWRGGVSSLLEVEGSSVEARDVNRQGQALVNVYQAGLSRVLLWEPDGTLTPVSADGVWSSGTDLSDDGAVSGIVATDDGQQRAVVWRGGQVQDLGDLGFGYVYASSINNRGLVAGTATLADWSDRAFVWQDGTLTELPLPDGMSSSVAYTVNERGDVLGKVDGEGAPPGGRAVVWDRGTTVRYLGTDGVRANDMNGSGVVVGSLEREPQGVSDAAVIDRRGVTPLRTPRGMASEARAVNDLGIAVGYEMQPPGEGGSQALAWVLGVPVQLAGPSSTSTVYGSYAVDVNGRGQAAGTVTYTVAPGQTVDRAVIWDLLKFSGRIVSSQ